jgi:signal transduction histidine kinase/ActR/RegA family two-component response regulator
VPSHDHIDRARRGRNTQTVAIATFVGSLLAAPICQVWGLSPAVTLSCLALAFVAWGVAWLAARMRSDLLPWVLLLAIVATASVSPLPDGQLRATSLTLLAAIVVAGAVLPALQVLAFAGVAVAAQLAVLIAVGPTVQVPMSSLGIAVAGVSLSAIVAATVALGARGPRGALGDATGNGDPAREAEAQKLEAVGRLAGGVAHDFNNILAVVQSGASLAREGLPPGHPAHGDLADVSAAADRGAALARQLLAFTRPEGHGVDRGDVRRVLAELARFVPRLVGAATRVRVSEEANLGEVPVSGTQLEQVILNLAINARDAMPSGGWIRIAARRREIRGGELPPLAAGAYVEIAVTDEGTGMSEEVRLHIFEPFFSTKEPGCGSGLGLATSLGIVARAGGAIDVESEPGKGSTFRVLLPRFAPPRTAFQVGGAFLSSARRSRVLIVDHDPALVALLSRLLAARGHEVATAATALEARHQAASFPGAVDVVVAGLDLGEGQGETLLGEVRRTSSQARAVLVAGNERDPTDVEHLLEAGVELVRRPVSAEALVEVVERVAGQAPVRRAPAMA